MGKGSHKVFNASVNELSESLPIVVESGSGFSYFIPEPINVSEVTILSADNRKPCLKSDPKEIKKLISNQTFLVDEPEKG